MTLEGVQYSEIVILQLGGLHEGEILVLTLRRLPLKQGVQRGI
jgi:hypothetical protein